MLCRDCERFRFPETSSATLPPTVLMHGTDEQASHSVKEDDQSVQDDEERRFDLCTTQHVAGAAVSVSKTHLPAQPNLVQCELLYFVQGHFGQYPESTIRSTILDFYREDEILGAKQVLVHAIECVESLNVHSYVKKRNGINKCRSSVDDIMNIIKLVDDHLCHDKLPTFCAVKRSRVPVVAEELSDMAAVRLELNQLRHQVEVLANQLSSASHCKCSSMKQSDGEAPSRRAVNTVKAAGRTAVGQLPSTSSVSEVCSNVNTTASMSEDDDKPSLSTDPTVPPAANSAQPDVNTEACSRSFANTVKEDVHKFEEVNRQSRQMRKNNQRRYVVGDSSAQTPFLGVSKKVFVCVSRLKVDTSVETIEDFLRSKGIRVISCFKYVDKHSRFSTMRVCISHSGEKKVFDPKLWPDGVIVRPWFFKSRQEEQ